MKYLLIKKTLVQSLGASYFPRPLSLRLFIGKPSATLEDNWPCYSKDHTNFCWGKFTLFKDTHVWGKPSLPIRRRVIWNIPPICIQKYFTKLQNCYSLVAYSLEEVKRIGLKIRSLEIVIYKVFLLFKRCTFCRNTKLLGNRRHQLYFVIIIIELSKDDSVVIDSFSLIVHKYLSDLMTLYALRPVENFADNACHL
jgi:hypothetical protein